MGIMVKALASSGNSTFAPSGWFMHAWSHIKHTWACDPLLWDFTKHYYVYSRHMYMYTCHAHVRVTVCIAVYMIMRTVH